ncbi:hypothetical protein BHE74_00019778 [Ensete ventricosum]|nr:hypothetical protein BHE74_00019778 [Ensete ventricosum]
MNVRATDQTIDVQDQNLESFPRVDGWKEEARRTGDRHGGSSRLFVKQASEPSKQARWTGVKGRRPSRQRHLNPRPGSVQSPVRNSDPVWRLTIEKARG